MVSSADPPFLTLRLQHHPCRPLHLFIHSQQARVLPREGVETSCLCRALVENLSLLRGAGLARSGGCGDTVAQQGGAARRGHPAGPWLPSVPSVSGLSPQALPAHRQSGAVSSPLLTPFTPLGSRIGGPPGGTASASTPSLGPRGMCRPDVPARGQSAPPARATRDSLCGLLRRCTGPSRTPWEARRPELGAAASVTLGGPLPAPRSRAWSEVKPATAPHSRASGRGCGGQTPWPLHGGGWLAGRAARLPGTAPSCRSPWEGRCTRGLPFSVSGSRMARTWLVCPVDVAQAPEWDTSPLPWVSRFLPEPQTDARRPCSGCPRQHPSSIPRGAACVPANSVALTSRALGHKHTSASVPAAQGPHLGPCWCEAAPSLPPGLRALARRHLASISVLQLGCEPTTPKRSLTRC